MDANPADSQGIFNCVARLTGLDGLDAIGRARVIVFGVGGVGSWTAEALVRSGITDLTIVDADRVALSNVNRQMPATTSTVGRVKVDVVRERLLDINPRARITAIHDYYNAETASRYDLSQYDYVIDAIDSLADKALLILNATSLGCGVRLFSSMGAALKMDPSRIGVAEFWKVTGCPLAAALRRRFKKTGQMPRRKFKCVYSPELLRNDPAASLMDDPTGAMTFNKAVTNGALVHITAIFGFTLASLVIRDILDRK